MLIRSILLALCMAGLSCTTPKRSESKVKYAHHKGSKLLGTPFGQQLALEYKLLENHKDIRVCIQNNSNLADEKILLETQLAYAFWYDASDFDPALNVDDLEFFVRDDCIEDILSYNGMFVFQGSSETILSSIQKQDISFSKPSLFCRKTVSKSVNGGEKTTTSCSNWFKTGKGGFGSTTIKSIKDEPEWLGVLTRFPFFVVTSPFVKWQSIDEVTFKNDEKKIAHGDIKKEYKRLLELKTRQISDMKELTKLLRTFRAIADDPVAPKDLIQKFQDSEDKQKRIPFEPELALFPTLLHEAGHQFGMLHADHPAEGSENGRSFTATMNNKGQWVTKIAAMAYGEAYLYLEEDDELGIKSVSKEISELFKKHVTKSKRSEKK